jgi:hypothetical protein
MAKKDDGGVGELVKTGSAVADPAPKLIVAMGRGRIGKSTFIRYAAENAIRRGKVVLIGDADRTNRTVSAFFDDVSRPEYDDDEGLREWLNGVIEQQVEHRFSFFLDLEGGDRVVKEHAQALALVDFCEEVGSEPVAVHFLGSSDGDLAYLRDIEASRSFAPMRTIIVSNEGILPPGPAADRAFAKIESDPIFRAVLDRGARSVRMPRLGCMAAVEDRRLQFEDAVHSRVKPGQEAVGLVNRQFVTMWLRSMEKAFAGVREWLP